MDIVNSVENHLFNVMNGIRGFGFPEPKPVGIEEEALASLESDLGIILPADFRSFFLKYGGCLIRHSKNDDSPCIKPLNTIPHPTTLGGSVVRVFFGGDRDPDEWDWSLRFNNSIAKPPHLYFAFGNDGIGGFYLVGVANQNYGQIFYFVPETTEWIPKVILVAQSFNDFMLSLYFDSP